jgi:hypothetical protein
MTLSHQSDDELLSEARRLLGAERKLTAKLVAYLAEIEDRRLHLVAGYGSMFDFCTRGLGLGENEAFRRITGAREGMTALMRALARHDTSTTATASRTKAAS